MTEHDGRELIRVLLCVREQAGTQRDSGLCLLTAVSAVPHSSQCIVVLGNHRPVKRGVEVHEYWCPTFRYLAVHTYHPMGKRRNATSQLSAVHAFLVHNGMTYTSLWGQDS